jgi:hypothetical protein
VNKKYWSKRVPVKEGWYWCKYRGKHGLVVCPCQIFYLDMENVETKAKSSVFLVRTAYNDSYTSSTRKEFGSIWFGEELIAPEKDRIL